MSKRKGSLYEQKPRVTPMFKYSEQAGTDIYFKKYLDEQIYHDQQQHHQIDNYHYGNDQLQMHDQLKQKENLNKNSKNNEENSEFLKHIIKQKKQNHSQSAQRSQSLDKMRQDLVYSKKQYFIENTLLQNNHKNNQIEFEKYIDCEMENKKYDKNQQLISKLKRRKEQESANLKSIAESSQRIKELRDNYVQQKGGIIQIEDSLANQLEIQTHYQDEFEQPLNFQFENEEFLAENISSHLKTHNRSHNQYRKAFFQTKNPLNQKTDTTDDQNISINPNNKSSSDEAIQTSADLKIQYKYDQYGIDHQSENYIKSHFLNPKKSRELSTSHDTTKLIDDESANKQQSSDTNNKSLIENNSFQKDQYFAYLPEISSNLIQNQYNIIDLITMQKHPEFYSGDSGESQTRSKIIQKQENKRNSPSQGSGCKQIKKNLSIISDQFEDYQVNIRDLQLCPKQCEASQNKSFSQKNHNKNNKRSKSETQKSRIYPMITAN